MHNNSLPPSDRDPEPDQILHNEQIRAAFRALRNGLNADHRPYTQDQLANKLGVSNSIVSQYLPSEDTIREFQAESGTDALPPVKYSGNITKFERRVRDLIAADQRRKRGGVATVECPMTESFRVAAEFVRTTNDSGALTSPSGSGKTRAMDWYMVENPTAVRINTATWSHDINSVLGQLFGVVSKNGYDRRIKRGDWVARQLAGSDKLIVVDDAHKLTRPALQLLFDLHDATQCPLLLVGTPALIDKIDDDPQRASRLGYREELMPGDPDQVVKHLVKEIAGTKELIGPACSLARGDGSLRRVEKHLKLASKYHEGAPDLGWLWAWEEACAKLKSSHSRN